MITIVKGSSKLVVTKGAFEEQFKTLGYRIASEDKGAAKEVAPLLKEKEEKEENQDNKEEESLSEKFGLKDRKGSISKKGN